MKKVENSRSSILKKLLPSELAYATKVKNVYFNNISAVFPSLSNPKNIVIIRILIYKTNSKISSRLAV